MGEGSHSVEGGWRTVGEREEGEGAGDEGEDCLEDWSKEEGVGEEDRRGEMCLPSQLPSHTRNVCSAETDHVISESWEPRSM